VLFQRDGPKWAYVGARALWLGKFPRPEAEMGVDAGRPAKASRIVLLRLIET
jgi:hypothetical protein